MWKGEDFGHDVRHCYSTWDPEEGFLKPYRFHDMELVLENDYSGFKLAENRKIVLIGDELLTDIIFANTFDLNSCWMHAYRDKYDHISNAYRTLYTNINE